MWYNIYMDTSNETIDKIYTLLRETREEMKTNHSRFDSKLETIDGRLDTLNSKVATNVEKIGKLQETDATIKTKMGFIATISGMIGSALMGLIVFIIKGKL